MSIIGVGGALIQRRNGREEIIAVYSKKLSPAAIKWSVYELELYGLIYALTLWRTLLFKFINAPFDSSRGELFGVNSDDFFSAIATLDEGTSHTDNGCVSANYPV